MKTLFSPEKALSWLCVLLPWAALGYGIRFSLFGLPTTALEIYLFILFVVFTVVRRPSGWRVAWKQLPSRWLLLSWIVIGALAAQWSPSLWKGLGLWRAYILEPILMLMIVNVTLEYRRDRDQLRTSLWTAAAFVSLWAVIQFLTGRGIPAEWSLPMLEGRRATGPYSFPNAVALFVAPITAYAGARWWWFRERLAGVVAILGLGGTLVARSDGGVIAILVSWFVVLVFVKRGRWLVGGATAAGAIGLALIPKIASSIWEAVTFQGWSGRVRIWMWQETWQMLKAHWFLGAGLGGYPIVFDAFHKKRFIEIFQYPHQFILTAWSEVGLIGLVIFIGLLITFGRRAWKSSTLLPQRMIGLAPLIAIVVHGFVDVPYWKNDLVIIFFLLWWLVAWRDEIGV